MLPAKTSGELRALAPPAPSPALTWVAKVKFIVRVTVVAPVPEGSVGFMVVADKDRKEDGGGALEEEAQQGQLQSPARGAAGRPGHGIEAASLRLRLGLLARGPGRHSPGGPGRFHSSQAPPTRRLTCPQFLAPAREAGKGGRRRRPEVGQGVGGDGAFIPPSPLSFGPADPGAVPVGTGPWK